MNQSGVNQSSQQAGSRRPLLSSPPKCHLIGGTISIALLAAIAFVCSQRNIAASQVEHGDLVVDVDQAAQLIQNADGLRQAYAQSFQQSRSLDDRVAGIKQWLPPVADWQKAHNKLQALAQSNGIKIVEFDEGGRHVGTRVGVAAATCRIEGSYVGVCKFLVGMTQGDQPIACNQIELQRAPITPNDDAGQSPCSATLSLRLPFAATGTVAARLLPPETNDAD